MAKRSSTRRTHVSPGIYYKETELQYATQSLGITTLGLAGETLKGPAFQPISISDWREYQTYFGGTSTEKFRGSQYPKYELPYIAQEYLKQSKQLEVVRTLGLSGVNAGPAWLITATKHECISVDGNDYTKEYDEEGNPVVTTDTITKTGEKSEDSFYGDDNNLTFSVPSPIIDKDPSVNEIGVIDAYQNIDFDIQYVGEESFEESFSQLPVGLQYEFGYQEGTYSDDTAQSAALSTAVNALKQFASSNWDNCFLTVDLDNGIKDGLVAIEYTSREGKSYIIGVYDIEDSKLISENHESDEYKEGYLTKAYKPQTTTNRYILIPRSVFEKYVSDNHLDYSGEFTSSNFKVYQYGYKSNDNADINNTGKTFKYKAGKISTICSEVSDAEAPYKNVVIAVLRSRGEHKNAVPSGVDECGNTTYSYDGIEYYAKSVSLTPSKTLVLGDTCSPGFNTNTGDFNASIENYGKFTISVNSIKGCDYCGVDTYYTKEYDVSLNPADHNYITKVIGTDPEVGDADIYVEDLYDVALEQLIYSGDINAINSEVAYYPYVSIVPSHAPVNDLLTLDSCNLTKKHLGKRYLYTYSESLHNNIMVRISTDGGITWKDPQLGKVGHIYTVMSVNNSDTGKKDYFYGEYRFDNGTTDGGILKGKKKFTEYISLYNYSKDVVKNNYVLTNCVKVLSDDYYYIFVDNSSTDTANEGEVMPITLDFNNYKEEYRYASTPWIVSEMKGSGENVKLNKLFRFHTISDGDTANTEIKVSIENIDPEMGIFDVVIRSFYDSDVNPNVLERYGKCCLTPGESNYLGLKVGTMDGTYVSQSAYVTVEINENDETAMSIPCGFLGYPVRNYNGLGIYSLGENETLSSNPKQPYVKFNTTLDEDIKTKKQYFGMSDLVGIDEDILTYKGVEAYSDYPEYLTPSFHLDSRILNGAPIDTDSNGNWYTEENGVKQVVSVEGITGYNWSTVDRTNLTKEGIEPRIGIDETMDGTIYEDKAARKFTVCFFGGWDGWDYYRTSRSNGDEYRYNKYKGSINKTSGQGTMFSIVKDPEAYGFTSDTKVITSDYYAYLAAVRQLDNPKTVTINLFATPGIDYVNQTALVQEIIDIVEEDRGDTLYVVTTPDKPFGAGDSKSEMYSPEDAVYNLEDTDIDTNYACTYYPWYQYYDSSNNQYIYLPVTLDVVRNMAYTDNIAQPWYASAGWNRGNLSGVGPKRKLKLGEQDTLYEGRINFVNSFAKEGDKIWGDKNLQVHDGIMNRISKRRLLIRLKNLLSTACVGLLFDPNDASMADTFVSNVQAVLDPIKKNRGITDYRIEVDDSAEARDRLELPAKIFIKPTQMLEYIDIDLVVTPQGVQWN